MNKNLDILAISKPSPILKGTNVKKLLDEMESPKDLNEFFKHCKESSKKFKVIK